MLILSKAEIKSFLAKRRRSSLKQPQYTEGLRMNNGKMLYRFWNKHQVERVDYQLGLGSTFFLFMPQWFDFDHVVLVTCVLIYSIIYPFCGEKASASRGMHCILSLKKKVKILKHMSILRDISCPVLSFLSFSLQNIYVFRVPVKTCFPFPLYFVILPKHLYTIFHMKSATK